MNRQSIEWGPHQRNRALIYLPDDIAEETSVVCFLHGIGEAANPNPPLAFDVPEPLDLLLRHGSPALHCEIDAPIYKKFIVICPQLQRPRRWGRVGNNVPNSDAKSIPELVENVISNCHGNKNCRKVLTGFSYGGDGVFELADQQPGYWSALWAVAPSANTCKPPKDAPVFIHFGAPDEQAPISEEGFELLEENEQFSRRLLEKVQPFRLGHSFTCAAAYSDPVALDWLWRVTRPTDTDDTDDSAAKAQSARDHSASARRKNSPVQQQG